nr:MAG: hypothetical protein [Bacteriophage sp.]
MELIQNAFEQGLVPGIVIVIYLIINKIIDNNKKDPLDDIAKLLNIVTKDIIDKDREKSKAVVSIAIVNAASECAKFVASTIITNNVNSDRDQIEYNARHLVNSVYYDTYSKLNMYRGDEDYLSHYMREEWKEDIYDDIINIIYNKHLDSNQRILAFNKRVDIRVSDYTAYIINKAFK